MNRRGIAPSLLPAALASLYTIPAFAGPPYVTDDPEPTPLGHYEIYLPSGGTIGRDGVDATTGLDFNYGAAPNLQLTAVLPVEVSAPRTGPVAAGIGNIELAAKYKLLHQESIGIDLAVFPRIFLPSPNRDVGQRHAAFLLPVWLQKDFGHWSVFGGGGCVLNRGGGSQDYCISGAVVTHQVTANLSLGAELYHQTADTRGGKPSTQIGAGVTYDLSATYHLMGWLGPGLQNIAVTPHYSWYSALQITF